MYKVYICCYIQALDDGDIARAMILALALNDYGLLRKVYEKAAPRKLVRTGRSGVVVAEFHFVGRGHLQRGMNRIRLRRSRVKLRLLR